MAEEACLEAWLCLQWARVQGAGGIRGDGCRVPGPLLG